ncbi:MAG: OPT family oligopeptide transporter [Deltaproteobacteria bacterium]|nr:OPT family oligopeptide transporter [Deltaproteobacteria bacterium]
MSTPDAAEPTPDTQAPKGADAPLVEDPDVVWLRDVYAGDHARQLTVRAVVAGMALGGLLSLSNLYVALHTGWSFGVTITAGVLAFAFFNALERVGFLRTPFGMLENNAMQSVASAAGYMTGGGTVAAIPAWMMATGQVMPWHVMFLWITAIAMLGVFMAIPMKRQMINREQLKFPSGIAAAETLKVLHASSHGGPSDGKARSLLWGAALGGIVTWLREVKMRWMPFVFPEQINFPWTMMGVPLKKWTLALDTSVLLLAAGAIMGWRSAWSMLLGTGVNYLGLAPYGVRIGAITEVKYKNIVGWTVWYGSSLLLVSGLLAFAFSWRQIARAFGDVSKAFRAKAAAKRADPYRKNTDSPSVIDEDPMARIEVPTSWFVVGMMVFTPVVMVLGMLFFGMSWWMGLLGVVMSFFIATVAARATGETDTTPTGALGKITQIVFGAVAPGSVTINLMSANLTAGVAIHSADLLTDLKSGYLLGAKPRQQFLGQFFGVMAGSLAVVPAFRLLVPDVSVIGTTRAPAPAAVSWYSVAQVLGQGLSRLPTSARYLIVAGVLTGLVLTLAERWFPKAKKYIPSATGFGLAFTLPATNVFSMFLGALFALYLEKRKPDLADKYIITVSSGIIAGESLLGIVVAILRDALHILPAAH